MMGFKDFESARKLIAGIETMHMIKKGQLRRSTGLVVSEPTAYTASPLAEPIAPPAFCRLYRLTATEPDVEGDAVAKVEPDFEAPARRR